MELIHPDTQRLIEVREDQAALYMAQGWKPFAAPAPLSPVSTYLVGEAGPEFVIEDDDA